MLRMSALTIEEITPGRWTYSHHAVGRISDIVGHDDQTAGGGGGGSDEGGGDAAAAGNDYDVGPDKGDNGLNGVFVGGGRDGGGGRGLASGVVGGRDNDSGSIGDSFSE
nr:unnamed protein product [Spirometra erinaceieuropaei]